MNLERRAPRRERQRARRALTPDPDGLRLLTSTDGVDFARAAVGQCGGEVISARLDHIDHQPGRGTSVLYSCDVNWPGSRRLELVGLTWRAGGLNPADLDAEVFHDDNHEVAAWIYPEDPDLPGLARATVVDQVLALLLEHRLVPVSCDASQLSLQMVSYRPRARAVVRASLRAAGSNRPAMVFYLKAFTAADGPRALRRLEMMGRAGLPVARLLAATDDQLLVLAALDGQPMAHHIFDESPAVSGDQLVGLLDELPAGLLDLPRRPAWADAVGHYADMVAGQLPAAGDRAREVARVVGAAADTAPADEPTHGDFHEGQLFLSGGRVSGLLDVEAAGPGRRVDDLACMIAHLSTVQHMDAGQAARTEVLIRRLLASFDARVDPVQLRLRAAGVAISLASGPYQEQAPDWKHQTLGILAGAEDLIRRAEQL
ncbi:Phosphotransferase family protein [Propionibacterium freudenreichii]|uniref:phosphotransferase family protein n=1 Tax=Propionibacterium freudenreichii TaxID=1744 RepID=UPI000BC344CE|nr:phosphotransferase [Propionibacterium freudenreichii]SBN60490.1 Phosphotransferase family protein [Propionibacterium freudenreichii]SBN95999.1 Phosphotransferase family protein [Propionibacterium freudenreichii]SBT29690.1 Phosphotransferase family protein [Propionibacterium freudenreichii]SCC97585.1 Phosphotransferase family protein [Propionibacterium freudenreichii]SCQ49203.1 Phosphotransferase family protein [Propionibacterium freudenreichii]